MNSRYKRKDGVVARHVAGETILVPVANNLADLLRIFVLNPVGEFIWERLDGASEIEDIAASIPASFDVGKEQAAAECRAFIDELLAGDLIVEA